MGLAGVGLTKIIVRVWLSYGLVPRPFSDLPRVNAKDPAN
jgi:hypothetical protein